MLEKASATIQKRSRTKGRNASFLFIKSLVEVMKIKKQEVTVVSSLDVTKTFGKLHKDVMESIRGIESNISRAEFSALLYKLYLQDFVWNERQAIKRKIRNQQKRKFA